MPDLLFNPAVILAFFAVSGISGFILITKHRKLSPGSKIIIGVLLVLCILYLAFLLWCIVAFGSNHPATTPTPMPMPIQPQR